MTDSEIRALSRLGAAVQVRLFGAVNPDAVQEAFIIALTHRMPTEPERRRAWFARLVANATRRMARDAAPCPQSRQPGRWVDLRQASIPVNTGLELAPDVAARETWVRERMAALPPADRELWERVAERVPLTREEAKRWRKLRRALSIRRTGRWRDMEVSRRR